MDIASLLLQHTSVPRPKMGYADDNAADKQYNTWREELWLKAVAGQQEAVTTETAAGPSPFRQIWYNRIHEILVRSGLFLAEQQPARFTEGAVITTATPEETREHRRALAFAAAALMQQYPKPGQEATLAMKVHCMFLLARGLRFHSLSRDDTRSRSWLGFVRRTYPRAAETFPKLGEWAEKQLAIIRKERGEEEEDEP